MDDINLILILILVTIFVLGVTIISFLTEISEYLKIISKDEKEIRVKVKNFMPTTLMWSFYILIAIISIFLVLNFFLNYI